MEIVSDDDQMKSLLPHSDGSSLRCWKYLLIGLQISVVFPLGLRSRVVVFPACSFRQVIFETSSEWGSRTSLKHKFPFNLQRCFGFAYRMTGDRLVGHNFLGTICYRLIRVFQFCIVDQCICVNSCYGHLQVINMQMPASLKQYIHRVGRTARAGRVGRSVSLFGAADRKLLKEIVATHKGAPLKQRRIDAG